MVNAKAQVLVVAEDPVYLNWLQSVAASAADFSRVRPLDTDDLLKRVQDAGRVDAVMLHFDASQPERRAAWAERLLERWPDLALAGIGSDSDPGTVLSAMRAGARDYFSLNEGSGDVAARLGRLLRRTAGAVRPDAAAPQGKLWVVLSSHPHESTAFVGGHLALAGAEQVGRGPRVLMADLAQPAGAAAVFFNLTPAYSVLDAIADVHRCDATLADTAFPRHASGLYVLSQPEEQMQPAAVNGEDLLRLTGVLRGLFALSVLSVDASLPVPLLAALTAQADRSLLVCDPSVIRSRRSKHLLRALRQENGALDRLGLVVDAYQRRLGLEPENLAELLELPLLGALGGDPVARLQAMNAGESLFAVAPRDAYCRDLRRLAQKLMTGAAAPEPAGLLDRWFR